MRKLLNYPVCAVRRRFCHLFPRSRSGGTWWHSRLSGRCRASTSVWSSHF